MNLPKESETAEELKPLRGFPGHSETILSMDWSPDGTMLASVSEDRTLRVQGLESDAPVRVLKFLAKHVPPEDKELVLSGTLSIMFPRYDTDLNGEGLY